MSALCLIASIWQPNAFSLVTEHAGLVETLGTNRHSKCTEGNVLLTATLRLFVAVMLYDYILFTFGLVDFPGGTWSSYTEQWAAYRSKRQFSFLFALLCSFFLSSSLQKGGAERHIWLFIFSLEGFAIFLWTILLWTAQARNTLWYRDMYSEVCLQCPVRIELEYLKKPFEAYSCLSFLSSKALLQGDWSCFRLCKLIASIGELLSSNWSVHQNFKGKAWSKFSLS